MKFFKFSRIACAYRIGKNTQLEISNCVFGTYVPILSTLSYKCPFLIEDQPPTLFKLADSKQDHVLN